MNVLHLFVLILSNLAMIVIVRCFFHYLYEHRSYSSLVCSALPEISCVCVCVCFTDCFSDMRCASTMSVESRVNCDKHMLTIDENCF
jgi:hypothetical protein